MKSQHRVKKPIQEEQSTVSVEPAQPGKVKEMLREMVEDKKQSDKLIKERVFLAEATACAKGKSCAEPQCIKTDTNKKTKMWISQQGLIECLYAIGTENTIMNKKVSALMELII